MPSTTQHRPRLRRPLGLALAAVCLIPATACGGGSAGSAGSTGAGAPAPKQELARFLSRVEPLRLDASRRAAGVAQALGAVASDPSTWDASATRIDAPLVGILRDGDHLAAIPAPVAVRASYRAYVVNYADFARVVSGMATNLRQHDTNSVVAWKTGPLAQLSADTRRDSALRVALIRYASRIGATLPPWVSRLGVHGA